LVRSALSLVLSLFATATIEIYTLSLHERSSDLAVDADHVAPLDKLRGSGILLGEGRDGAAHEAADHHDLVAELPRRELQFLDGRSEEHTSELQSRSDLVCRLLLEKKKPNSNRWA